MVAPAALARLAPILARGAKIAKTGLTHKYTGVLVGTELAKTALIHPTFRRLGLGGKPHATAPAPIPGYTPTLQEQVLYGTPRRGGLLGSELGIFGGRRAVPGLLERKFEKDSKHKVEVLRAQILGQQMGYTNDLQRQQLVSNTQRYLGRQQAQRDITTARLNNASNTGANLAAIISGRGINNPTRYGAPLVQGQGIVQTGPRQQISGFGDSYLNPYYGGGLPRRGYRRRYGNYYY